MPAFEALLGKKKVSLSRSHASCLLEALRRATHDAHTRLEGRLPIGPCGRSVAEYRAFLSALHGFHAPLEAKLEAVADRLAPLDWQPRRKVHLLREDLLALGFTAEDVDALPQADTLPPISDGPAALGALYVVEGATLGGRVISRQLRQSGITPRTGGRFFHGYGQDTGLMWREFVGRLQAGHGEHYEHEERRAVGTAVAVFEAFESWLDGTGTLR